MHHLSIYNIVIKIGTEAREICAIYEEGKFSLNTCRKLVQGLDFIDFFQLLSGSTTMANP